MLNEKLRIVITCRSACAAWSMIAVSNYLGAQSDIELYIFAQMPASKILASNNIQHQYLDMELAKKMGDPASDALLNATNNILDEISPAVVIAGLSTPGEGGIDEAIILQARCPTFVIQDFWGDCNLFFEKHPDCYLSIDEHGARLTDRLHGAYAQAVGSPRHAKYIQLQSGKMVTLEDRGKRKIRIGLLTQPMFEIDGYEQTMNDWLCELSRIQNEVEVAHRPHPECPSEDIEKIDRMARAAGLELITDNRVSIEEFLHNYDTISSVMSNSNIDATYINYFSKLPACVPHYMLWNENIQKYLSRFHNLRELPTITQNLAIATWELSNLGADLQRSFSNKLRMEIWRNSSGLEDPEKSLEKIELLVRNPKVALTS